MSIKPKAFSSYEKAMKVYANQPPGGNNKSHAKKVAQKKLNTSLQQLKALNAGKNTDLDFYFEIQRREHVAASVIQKIWKKSRRLIPWRIAVKRMLSIVKIQKTARGFLARKFVARWFIVRTRIATELQARIRKYLSNLHLRPKLAKEQVMAVRIQRIIRGKLGRWKARRCLEDQAVRRIQCLWRGSRDRAMADKKWLNQKVIVIQNAMRKALAIRHFSFHFSRYNDSATKIQRLFRSYLASNKVGRMLYEREMKYRHDMIRLLSNEEEICEEKIVRLMNRVVKQRIRENTQQAMQAILQSEKEIYIKENDLIELRRQREILSPRSIERGFYQELTKNIEETHSSLSQMKFHHLFVLSRQLHQHERIFENQVAELEELAALRNRVSKWRVEEYDERVHVNYQRDINDRRKEKRQAIAEEKRKWQVLYYTKDGKPDKKRRPGRPWDPSVYAGPERATYDSVTGVDLLAFLRPPEDIQKAKTTQGIVESVQNTVDQYSLQNFLDQVQVYQQLLNPISNILQKHLQILPGQQGFLQATNQPLPSPLQEGISMANTSISSSISADSDHLGFGPMGKEFTQALRDIGVDPPVEMNAIKKNRGLISKEEKQRRNKTKNPRRIEEEFAMAQQDYQSVPIMLDPGSTIPNTAREGSKPASAPPSMIASPLTRPPSQQQLVSLNRTQPLNTQRSSIESEGEVITAEALRQRLRRYWKKPYQQHMPSEESFANVDFGKYDYGYYYPHETEEDDDGMSSTSSKGRRRRQRNKKKKGNNNQKKKRASPSPTRPTITSKSLSQLSVASEAEKRKHTESHSQISSLSPSPAKLQSSTVSLPMKQSMLPPLPATSKFVTKFSDMIATTISPMDSIGSPSLSEQSYGSAGLLFDPSLHERQKAENLAMRKELHEKRRERKRQLQASLGTNRGSVIPWEMLDELDGAKTRFENEKAYVEFYKKF